MPADASIPMGQLSTLRQKLVEHFNQEELLVLCFDLGVDHEELPGQAKSRIVQELLTYLERRDRVTQLVELLEQLRPAVDWGSFIPAEPDAEPPFKGLQYFTEADERIFFGRDTLTAELVDHLREHRFLAVVGASGSGKSSVLRAGLVPAVREGAIKQDDQTSAVWPVHVITPGDEPLKALAATLTRDAKSVTVTKTLAADMQADNESLGLWLYRELAGRNNARLLLVVDQFEELFTQCDDPETQRLFVENLTYAVQSGKQGRLCLILGLRADFYAPALQYEALVPLLETQQRIVETMTATELRQAIEGPAEMGKWQFQPGLVETILQDLGAGESRQPEPGALPLLSHALLETWQRRKGRVLTLAGYRAAGGVQRAIATTADRVYGQMTSEQQTIARRIFLRLTELGEGTEDTRRRVQLDELIPQTEAEGVQNLLQLLTNARLVMMTRDSVEVAHEALIREWPRLRTWLDENRESLQLHRRLTQAAGEWEANQRDPSYLYRESRLSLVEGWLESDSRDLSSLEWTFIEASLDERDRQEEVREEQRRQKEQLKAERATAKRLRYRTRLLIIAIAAALIFAAIAFVRQRETERSANEIQSLALSVQAQQALLNNDRDLGIILALQANQIEDPPIQAQRVLAEAAYPAAARLRFDGHTDWVWSVAFSPDGLTVLSGSFDNSVRQWNAVTGDEIQRLAGHTDPVRGVAYSPDGRTAVSGSSDTTLILWDLERGEAIQRFVGHEDEVMSVAFDPDGHSVISGSLDGSVRMWDVVSGQEIRRFEEFGEIWSVAMSPDGRTALFGLGDGSLALWNISSSTEIHLFEGHFATVLSVAFSPDGRSALSGSRDGNVILWNLETGEEVRRFIGHSNWVWSVVYSPDGKTALSGSADRKVIQWNVETGNQIHEFVSHMHEVQGVAFSPDGRTAISGSRDTYLYLLDLFSGAEIRRFDGHTHEVSRVVLSSDGQTALSGSHDNNLILWDVVSGQEIRRFVGHIAAVSGLAISPDGSMALSGGGDSDHSLRLWNLVTGREIRRFFGHTNWVTSVAFSPDSRTALSGSHDHDLILWDVASGQEIRRFEGHSNWVTDVAFSPDGNSILSGSRDHSLIFWNFANGEVIHHFTGHSDWVWSIAFSPDGRTSLSGSNDGSLILWDLETREEVHRLVGHTGWVWDVAFSPDGQFALSSSADRSLILWDLYTGEEIRRFTSEIGEVKSIALSADGRTALFGTADGSLHLWPIHTLDELISWTRDNRAVREISCPERLQYRIEPFCEEE